MRRHRVCTAVHLCGSAPLALCYLLVALGAALALSGTLLSAWITPVGLDRVVSVCLCAICAPLALAGGAAACAVTRGPDARCCRGCRSARVVAAHGALTSVVFVLVAFLTGVLAAVAASLLGSAGDGTVLSYLVDAGCAAASNTCCERYPASFSCTPLREPCEAQAAVNSTVTLRGLFASAAEESRYFVWGGSGLVTLTLLTVVVTSFRLCVAIKQAKKDEEFAPDKELYIVDAFRWDSRGMNDGKGKKEAVIWVTDEYRVDTWPRG